MDRNPQTFVDIPRAEPEDFKAATQQVFRSKERPSSSHTVGPMRAANFLLTKLKKHGLFDSAQRIRCDLYGSLASTGRGHHTDRAVIWGLQGEEPETIDPDQQDGLFDSVLNSSVS